MSDTFCVVDKGWRLIYINSRAEQITRRKKADLLGNLVWDVFPRSIGAALYNRCHQKSDEGSKLRAGVFCSQLDKAWIEINAMPSPLGLAFHFRDVTKQRRSIGDLEQLFRSDFLPSTHILKPSCAISRLA